MSGVGARWKAFGPALAATLILGAATADAYGQARGREEGRQSGGGESKSGGSSSSSSSGSSSSDSGRSREERNQSSGGGGSGGGWGDRWTLRRHPIYRYGTVYDNGQWRELEAPPARTRIVFVSDRERGEWELFSMDPYGKQVRRLTRRKGEERHPSLSSDGRWVVFAGRSGDGPLSAGGPSENLWLCDVENPQSLRPLTAERPGGSDRHPRYSPDGTRIAFVSDRDGNPELYALDAATGANVLRLTNDPANDTEPAFSPDGARVVFSSDRGGALYRRLYVMDSLGNGTPTQLRMLNPSGQEETFDAGHLAEPTFSPDGTRIAFSYRGDIYVAQSDGSGLRRLTRAWGECSRPTWSPDGHGIAFTARREGAFGVYLMGAAVGEEGGIVPLSDRRSAAGSTDWR